MFDDIVQEMIQTTGMIYRYIQGKMQNGLYASIFNST